MDAPTETVFFDRGGITVTRTRVITSGQTFALAGVTSVRAVQDPPKRVLAILLTLIISFILALLSVALGVVVFVAAVVAILLFAKPVYEIHLDTAGGDSVAFTSRDKTLVWDAYQAVQRAIVERG